MLDNLTEEPAPPETWIEERLSGPVDFDLFWEWTGDLRAERLAGLLREHGIDPDS